MSTFIKYTVRPIKNVISLLIKFFDTAPDLMSDSTARKLRDEEESRNLIEEIRRKRHRHSLAND